MLLRRQPPRRARISSFRRPRRCARVYIGWLLFIFEAAFSPPEKDWLSFLLTRGIYFRYERRAKRAQHRAGRP